tara:strand:- start:252 stop:413 length:162 start_codon:yes stop_codon:yes gene_type:complete
MKKKIIDLINNNRNDFWDNESFEDYIPLTEQEQRAVDFMDNQLALDIIKLFKK